MKMTFVTQQPNPGIPDVLDVDPKEVWEKSSDVVVVDVRRPDEFTGELGHVPGAKHIVLDTLPDHMDEIPADKTVVFCCLSGGRSSRACAFAMNNGFENVYNLKGGMKLWNELGLVVEGRSEY